MERVLLCTTNIGDLYNFVWTAYASIILSIYFPKWIVFKLLMSVISQLSHNDPLTFQVCSTNIFQKWAKFEKRKQPPTKDTENTSSQRVHPLLLPRADHFLKSMFDELNIEHRSN